MIRPLTLICVMLFLFAGFYDYQTTHRVDLIDQQIENTRAAAAATRDDTKVLQTEWSWLNRPDRLQPFAAQFLSLQQVTPAQYVALDQLSQHLPEPGAAPLPVAAPVNLPATIIAEAAPAAVKPAEAGVTEIPQLALAIPAGTPADHAPPKTTEPAVGHAELVEAQPVVAAPIKLAANTNVALASIERDLQPVVPAHTTPSVLAAAEPVALKPVELAAAPARLAVRLAPARQVRLAALAPVHRVTAGPVPSPLPSAVIVADNEAARPAAAPRTLSALGMAQGASSLPAPVAVSDAAFRSDQ